MNWYKKAQLNKDAGLGKTFLGLSIPVIAVLLGISNFNVEDKIKNNPQGLKQEIEQKQVEQNINTNQIKSTPQSVSEDLYKMIERHEGKKNKVYYDTENIPTIGIGFNLTKADASQKLSNLGVNIQDILNGKSLTDKQVYSLFKEDVNTAISNARSFLPSFDRQPETVKNVIVDMAFNLGINRLSGFKDFRKALENNNYQEAANEMINSRWYSQVGNRSKELVNRIKSVQ